MWDVAVMVLQWAGVAVLVVGAIVSFWMPWRSEKLPASNTQLKRGT
jgi:hypothetical protein